MAETSVHQEHAEKAEAPARRTCSYCGEPSGSISKGTGRPLVIDQKTGEAAHVNCKPCVGIAALERMVA